MVFATVQLVRLEPKQAGENSVFSRKVPFTTTFALPFPHEAFEGFDNAALTIVRGSEFHRSPTEVYYVVTFGYLNFG